MARVACQEQHYRLLAAFSLGLVMLAGNSLFAEEQNGPSGVAPWQARRAIAEYIGRAITRQQEKGTDPKKVRIKIEDLVRVYSKKVGWIWVAKFSGAVLPNQYSEGQETVLSHGLLKICADENGAVQLVVNEGEGLTDLSQKVTILAKEMPESPGGWKEWGGDPSLLTKEELELERKELQQAAKARQPDAQQETGSSTGGGPGGGGGPGAGLSAERIKWNNECKRLAEVCNEKKALWFADRKNQEKERAYQEAYKAWKEKLEHPPTQ